MRARRQNENEKNEEKRTREERGERREGSRLRGEEGDAVFAAFGEVLELLVENPQGAERSVDAAVVLTLQVLDDRRQQGGPFLGIAAERQRRQRQQIKPRRTDRRNNAHSISLLRIAIFSFPLYLTLA